MAEVDMRTETKRHVRNPHYRVTWINNGVVKTWLFSYREKELALACYRRFKVEEADVRLFVRKWCEYEN